MERNVKLRTEHLCRVFFSPKKGHDHPAVADISLEVYENEFLVLLGPGQCGKTVLLNMISGLETPTGGKLWIDGEEITKPSPKLATVFQRMAILPWKNSIENVEMGPKYRGVPKQERRESGNRFLKMVNLEGFEKSYPRQLSGGMKQRVGIARAYNAEPDILLMDEPFGALDAQTRYQMQDEILKIWNQKKRTVIFITNNIEEAIYLGDRIILLSKRPAEIKAVYDLSHLARPRDLVSKEFMEIRREITDNMDLALE